VRGGPDIPWAFLDGIPWDEIDYCFVATVPYIPTTAAVNWQRCMGVMNFAWRAGAASHRAWKLALLFPRWLLRRPADGGGLAATINEHCSRFMAGDWASLHDEAKRSGPPPGAVDSDSVARALGLVRAGALSKAARILVDGGGPLQLDPQRIEQLRRKHPARMSPMPDDLISATPSSTPLPHEDIWWALDYSPKHSAQDHVGWRFEHLRAIPAGPLRIWLYTMCQALAAELPLPAEVEACVTKAWGLALPKPESNDLRPIEIGLAFRRLVSRAVAHSHVVAASEFFQPLQWGVGARGGPETVARVVSLTLAANPGYVAIKFDAANAYNSVSRAYIASQLNDHFPDILPWFMRCYRDPAAVRFRNQDGDPVDVESVEGVQQGDPLGSLLFCVALHPVLQRVAQAFHTATVVAYQDDIHVVCPPDLVIQIYDCVRSGLEAIGLRLRLDKCEVYSPSGDQECHIPGAKFSTEGLTVVGIPVGSPSYQREVLRVKTGPMAALAAAVGGLPDCQCALLLLRECVATRFGYWLRVIPPGISREAASHVDSVTRDNLSRLLDLTRISGVSAVQAALPLSLGGLNIGAAWATAMPAFLASWAAFYSVVSQSHPHLADYISGPDFPSSCLGVAVAETEGWVADLAGWWDRHRGTDKPLPASVGALASALGGRSDKLQRRLRYVDAKRDFDSLLVGLRPSDCARLRSISGVGASDWLRALPSEYPLTLSNETMKTRLRAWLGLPFPQRLSGSCAHCQAPIREQGEHFELCQPGYMTRRHTRLRKQVAAMGRAAGFSASEEPPYLFPDSREKVDVLLMAGDGVRDLGIDVCVACPLAVATLQRAAAHCGVAARVAERGKDHQYTSACADVGIRFMPAVVESFGTLGKGFVDLLHTLKTSLLVDESTAYNWSAPSFVPYWRQRISVTVQRETALHCLQLARAPRARF